jgi:hypothetical protein
MNGHDILVNPLGPWMMDEVAKSGIKWSVYYDKANNLVAIPDENGCYKQYQPAIEKYRKATFSLGAPFIETPTIYPNFIPVDRHDTCRNITITINRANDQK